MTSFMKFRGRSGTRVWKSHSSRQELSHECSFAKIGVDTAKNEPLKLGGDLIHFLIRLRIAHVFPSPVDREARTRRRWGANNAASVALAAALELATS